LAEVYNGFNLQVLRIGMKLNSNFAAKLEYLDRYVFEKAIISDPKLQVLIKLYFLPGNASIESCGNFAQSFVLIFRESVAMRKLSAVMKSKKEIRRK